MVNAVIHLRDKTLFKRDSSKKYTSDFEPSLKCKLCPRLVRYREDNNSTYPKFHNAPVPSFGRLDAHLLIVGLAPGLKGANKTGRPFTGDYAGDLLYATLIEHGFAKGFYGAKADDGLQLVDVRITNAVRCVPPENRPVGIESANCRSFLIAEINAMKNLKVILALGTLAHKAVIASKALKQSTFPFSHNAFHNLGGNVALADSYHCSRYNTNTGRLTERMFSDVFKTVKQFLI